MPKRSTNKTYIMVRCSPSQKRTIEEKAKTVGARSVNEYTLTVLLEGETEEYGTLRRKAEGALVNSQTYHQLIQLNQALRDRSDSDTQLVREAIALIEQVGREVVLARLANKVEQIAK